MSDQHEIIRAEVAGQPVLVALPIVAEDDPPRTREGIARRRLAERTGVCPCGARLVRTTARFAHTEVRHAPDCPARDPWDGQVPR